MFFENEATLDLLTRTLVLGPITVLWVVIAVRVIGLRSFSKMTVFDFVITVAIGSLLANAAVATQWPAFIQSSLAILAILAIQALLAWLRRASETADEAMSNDPVLLFRDGAFNRDAMEKTRVSESDIWAKMREANVLELDTVQAVVLETTGDISVLHGDALEDRILTGVTTARSEEA
ncbi:MAG: YetF domain-containing protein [Pseudomonadota bacterium]